jgi:hypothetical protein
MPSREEIHKAYREGEETAAIFRHTRDVEPPQVWLTVPRRVYSDSQRIAMREGIPARRSPGFGVAGDGFSNHALLKYVPR